MDNASLPLDRAVQAVGRPIIWLTMTSLEYGIHFIFGPGNTNTLKKLESEYIYGHEYEYISFLAQEYEYIYPLGEVNMGTYYNTLE